MCCVVPMRLYRFSFVMCCVLLFRLPVIYFSCVYTEIHRKTWKHFRYIVKLTCTRCEPYDMIENKLLESKSSTWNLLAKVANIYWFSFSFRYLHTFHLVCSCFYFFVSPIFVMHFIYSLLFYYSIRLFFRSRKCCCLNNGTNRFMLSLFCSCARVYLEIFSCFSLYLVVSCNIIQRVREFSDFKNTVEVECTYTFRHIVCVWLRVSFLKHQKQHQQR